MTKFALPHLEISSIQSAIQYLLSVYYNWGTDSWGLPQYKHVYNVHKAWAFPQGAPTLTGEREQTAIHGSEASLKIHSFRWRYACGGFMNYQGERRQQRRIKVTLASLEGCTWPLRLTLGRQLGQPQRIHSEDKLQGKRFLRQHYFPPQSLICLCVTSTLVGTWTLVFPLQENVTVQHAGGSGAASMTSPGLPQAVRQWAALLDSSSWAGYTQQCQLCDGQIGDLHLVLLEYVKTGARGLGRNRLLDPRQETRYWLPDIVNFSLTFQFA